ncbi:hypothetical protein SAMN05660485_02236 [Blastococcus fimeti]|nr:hypothetical protein SAMN05660485_02236 [Blastococcus fimeti]
MTAGADWVDSARRLLDAFRPPADATSAAPEPGATPDLGANPDPGAAHGADCRWCPVCQAAAVLRGERPDVTAAVADVLATTASVLRDLAGEPSGPGAPAAADDDAEPDDEPGPAAVQRIDIA